MHRVHVREAREVAPEAFAHAVADCQELAVSLEEPERGRTERGAVVERGAAPCRESKTVGPSPQVHQNDVRDLSQNGYGDYT